MSSDLCVTINNTIAIANLTNKKSNLYKEVEAVEKFSARLIYKNHEKAVENSAEKCSARLNYKKHEKANYKSSNLSKSLNLGIKIIYSKVINLQ
ncbi:17986_t:CDS:2 [Gigaspora margarita]|uniref:17986_t:CDS:1 n=1 Tax=Gigaspora margarita TaxID=4874 RepID=A0ABM8VXT7_GIGMA|nr:17986_t:CDS:2 [Gigaspora margarita]